MKNSETAGKLKKYISKYKYVLIVILAGIVLLSLQSGRKTTRGTADAANDTYETTDISFMEDKLEKILSSIEGVGKTEVVLTLKSGAERILAADTDISANGEEVLSSSRETVIISSSGSGETPVVVKQLMPVYQGALIVCQGGGNAKTQMLVTQAVSALTGLGSDKIQVTKMS